MDVVFGTGTTHEDVQNHLTELICTVWSWRCPDLQPRAPVARDLLWRDRAYWSARLWVGVGVKVESKTIQKDSVH